MALYTAALPYIRIHQGETHNRAADNDKAVNLDTFHLQQHSMFAKPHRTQKTEPKIR